jgi:hypothetical protein
MVYSSYWSRSNRGAACDSGRVKGMPIIGALGRVLIPPVVLTAIGAGGYAEFLACAVLALENQRADSEPTDVSAYTHCLSKSA